MKAEEYIKENYPVSAIDMENGKCVNLKDIAFICEQYHKEKMKDFCKCNPKDKPIRLEYSITKCAVCKKIVEN